MRYAYVLNFVQKSTILTLRIDSATRNVTIERFEYCTVLYEKLEKVRKVTNHRIISYRLDEKRMFTNGLETLNALFSSSL